MNTQEKIGNMFTNAMSELVANNYGKSIELLSDIVEQDPNHKLALVARGSAYLKLGDARSAVSDFSRAIDLDPDYARAYHLRGLACENKGDGESALIDFDKAIELDPEYGAAYYSRATLLSQMGRTEQASEDIQMVTHLTNRNIETFANESNVWRSQHMKLESILETEIER